MSVALRLPNRGRAALDRIVVDGAVLRRPDGALACVLRSGDLDIGALDGERRAAAVASFGRLCRSMELPLQLVLQVRRRLPDAATPEITAAPSTSTAGALADAAARHRAHVLTTKRVFRRTLLAVVSAHDEASLQRGATMVHEAFEAAGAGALTLQGADLAKAVTEAWGGDTSVLQRPDGALRLLRPTWTRHRRHAEIGTTLVRGRCLTRLPGVPVAPGWLAPLLDVAAECDLALHIRPVHVADAVSGLTRRLRDLRSSQIIDLDRDAILDAGVDAGMDGALDLRSRLARNEGRALSLSLTALTRAHDLEALDRADAVVAAAFSALMTDSQPLHLQHLEAVDTVVPAGVDAVATGKLVDSTAVATCVPWHQAGCDEPGGYAFARLVRSGEPVRLAPFDASRHHNANIAVFAASGHGKSYAIGSIVLEAAATGVGSVIIDPEGEYEGVVRALDGHYLHLTPGHADASLNVFEIGDVADSERDRDAEVVAAVVDLVAVLCGGAVDEVERALVDRAATAALVRARADGRPAVLGDCLPSLEETAPRIALVLGRFCHGPLGELFNRPTRTSLRAAVVGISLRDLPAELVPAATLVVGEWLWSLVRRERRRRHVVFDEVGLLAAHPPLRTLLVQLARRCRKYGASLVVATQNAGDLLATEEGRVVATNPALVLLGGHRSAETTLMQAAFALTDGQRRQLESAGRGEFLLVAGARRIAVRVDVSPLHHALLTGAAPPPARSGRIRW